MKRSLCALSLSLAWASFGLAAAPLGTAFTYQGRLQDSAAPASGTYELKFTLHDALTEGLQVGPTLTNLLAIAADGLVTTHLDFGSDPATFGGDARWLEIAVRTNGSTDFTVLRPRQPLPPTPYALQAARAAAAAHADTAATATAASAIPWAGVTGVPAGFSDGTDNDTTYRAGTGLALAGDVFALDTALTDARYWKLDGNARTLPGEHYLGTSDNTPLDFRVFGLRAWRLEPTGDSSDSDWTPDGAPNVIGGAAVNKVSVGIVGATIAGGESHQISDYSRYTTIGGGRGNAIGIDSPSASIGGGTGNAVGTNAPSSTVAGGEGNAIADNSAYTAVGGGYHNTIGGESDSATIGGGESHQIGDASRYTTIGGGRAHTIGTNAPSATIGGGTGHTVAALTDSGTIAGGRDNQLGVNTDASTIAGGHNNAVANGSLRAAIGGGYANTIGTNAPSSTLAGGEGNAIADNSAYTAIGGGYQNAIGIESDSATIGGGESHQIGDTSRYTTVGGGRANTIGVSSPSATIAGGAGNAIATLTDSGTIAGGRQNQLGANTDASTIAGGHNNAVAENSWRAAIGGGYQNTIATNAPSSTIAGGEANHIEPDAHHATIPGGQAARAYLPGQLAYAGGSFATPGDAQTSLLLLRNTTTGTMTSELFLDGIGSRLTVPLNAAWAFDILLIGRTSGANSCGYHFRGTIENSTGNTNLEGPVLKDTLNEDILAFDATVEADNANDALVIRVTGSAPNTIRWVASVRIVEVRFP